MRRIVSTVVWLPVWALALAVHPALAIQRPDERRPNIVVFVGDDLGWRDTEPYGNAAVRTPNIDPPGAGGPPGPVRVRHVAPVQPVPHQHADAAATRTPPAPRTCTRRCRTASGCCPSLSPGEGYFTGHMAKTHYGPQRRAAVPVVLARDRAALPRFPRRGGHAAVLPLGRLPRAAPAV